MKKTIFIIIFLIFLLPNIVLAECGGGCGVAGGGIGNTGGSPSSEACGIGAACVWNADQNSGVRITLYMEENNSYKKIGESIDILNMRPTYISDPSKSNVLRDRIAEGNNCSKKSVLYYTNWMIKWNDYNKKYKYYGGSTKYNIDNESLNLTDAISKGKVARWIFDTNKKTGWLQDNLFSKMKTDQSVIKDLFSLSSSEYKAVVANGDNIYITAELLMSVYQGGNSDWFMATVTELANTIIRKNYIAHMKVSQSNYSKETNSIGKLVTNSGPIKPIEITGDETSIYYRNGFYSDMTAGKTLCHKSWGMAIWYLKDCCPECTQSCQLTCEKYETGTAARTACAQGYCDKHPEQGEDCVSVCSKSETTQKMDGGCDNYECKVVTPASKDSNPSVCGDGKGDTASFEANVCYDDDTNYSFLNVSINDDNIPNHEKWSVKYYYKVSCTENTTISELPTKMSNAWLTKENVGSLHLGFSLNYGRKCELFYKGKNGGWKQNFADSKLQSDIASLKESEIYTNEMISKLDKAMKDDANKDSLEELQKEKETYVNILDKIQKAYDELAPLAPIDSTCVVNKQTVKIDKAQGLIDSRLLLLTELDHKGTNYFSENVKLEVPNVKEEYNGEIETVNDYLVLEPVACHETPQTTTTTSVEYCAWREDLQKYTTRTTTTTTTNTLIECDNVDENGNSTPIKAKIADNKYTATYGKTLYYELPDSYVLVHSDDDGKTFYSEATVNSNNIVQSVVSAKELCNDFLKKEDYSGKCLKKDNLYQFPQFKDKLIVDKLTSSSYKFNYSLNIGNIGYCGEKIGGYTYSCSYQFKEDTECVKCSQYTKGTAEYNACYEANCSCEAICNGNVACEQKYCPTNCVSCGDSTSTYEDVDCNEIDDCDPTKNDCCNNECSKNYAAGTDALSACQYECCSKNANGNTQALANCCYNYCEKTSGGSNNDKYKECVQTWCDCPECEGGLNFVYRSIDINDPFNGREKEEDGVGLNWRGKIGYITEENNSKNKQYYDSTNSTVKNEITSEYIVDLSSDMIKSVKKNREIGGSDVNTTYQSTNESKTTHSKVGASNSEETVDPYCSYLLHDVLETNGVLKQNDTAGMRCK